MPRRRPTGWIFCPMLLRGPRGGGSRLFLAARRRGRLGRGGLRLALRERLEPDRRARALLRLVLRLLRADRDRDVREALALERRAASRTGIEALGEPAAGPAVDGDARDEQTVRVHVVVVLGVGDGGAQQLLDRLGREHARELEEHERFAHALAADRVGDAAQLARAHARELQVRDGLGAFCSGDRHDTFALSPAWPLKVRVGENSPSLCPTMFSVTKAGMCALPLCTEIVCPTIAGTIVDARDQVLMTRFSRVEFIFSTLAIRWSATNGPFFSERPMLLALPLADDHLGGALVAARLLAHRHLAPRRRGRAARRRARFTAAVRVVDGVHRDTAHRRALPEVALAAGLADDLVLVIEIAELADGGAADDQDAPDFARRHAHLRVVAFLGHELRGAAGAAHELAALAGLQLDVVDDGAERDVRERQRVADLDVGGRTGLDHVADLEQRGREDVALLAVAVVQQREPRRAVGVVLDRGDLRRNRVLGALEIDDAVLLAVAAAFVARRDVAVVVAARVLLAHLDQRPLRILLRDLAEVGGGDEPPRGAGRLIFLYSHLYCSK